MSIQDPIANMLTCIRNGQNSYKSFIILPLSKIKNEIAKILKQEGYITDYEIIQSEKKYLKVVLKYHLKKAVIEKIKRVSKPSLRIYKSKNKLPRIMQGLGIAIISTSKGLMTDKTARNIGIGGEIICYVS